MITTGGDIIVWRLCFSMGAIGAGKVVGGSRRGVTTRTIHTMLYDGPIYGYDGLPPDQVVANVQGALQRLGYYQGAIDGVLGPATQEAIENYQRHQGLPVTGGIDHRTLASMGFTQ